ncbi:MAG: POTRA domain-containing protein, partial [Pseudomonadota bacterium]
MFKRFYIALFLMILSFSAASYAAEVMIIDEINITGLSIVEEELVFDVINLKLGERYSDSQIDEAISRLRKWGIFDTIELTIDEGKKGVILNFNLSEARIVAQIEISGNFPFLTNKVRKYLTLHAGDIYTPGRIDEQIQRIKIFYVTHGFLNTEVVASEVPKPEKGGILLTFHILKGELLRYRNIEVEGNDFFPKGRFVSYINPLKPFSEKRLRQSIRKIDDAYSKAGFIRARVKVEEKIIDYENQKVDIKLKVVEGKRLHVSFVGNYRQPTRKLKKILPLVKEGAWDSIAIRRSEALLERYYKLKGFADVKVKHNIKTVGNDVFLIFQIDEGEPKIIKFLNFKDVKDVSSKELRKGLNNMPVATGVSGAFRPEKIEDDSIIIEDNFKRFGYLNAKVGEWKMNDDKSEYALNISVPAIQGEQTMVRDVNLEDAGNLKRKPVIKALNLKPGKPFDALEAENEKSRLVMYLADNGYPYADVTQSISFDESGKYVDITYTFKLGEEVRIGRILIVGDLLSSKKAIKKAMAIKEGGKFSYRGIMESQLNIRRLGAFSAVNIETIGLEERLNVIHLVVRVEEQRPFRLETELSYSTDEKVTGAFTFTNLNAFGWAKINTLKLIGGFKLSRVELSWLDPRFLSSNFEMSTIGWFQYRKKPVFSYFQAGGALSWFRRFTAFSTLFRYEVDRNYLLEGDSTAADQESLRNNTISKITLSASYDKRDSFSDPRSGYYLLGSTDIYNEIRGDNAD